MIAQCAPLPTELFDSTDHAGYADTKSGATVIGMDFTIETRKATLTTTAVGIG